MSVGSNPPALRNTGARQAVIGRSGVHIDDRQTCAGGRSQARPEALALVAADDHDADAGCQVVEPSPPWFGGSRGQLYLALLGSTKRRVNRSLGSAGLR